MYSDSDNDSAFINGVTSEHILEGVIEEDEATKKLKEREEEFINSVLPNAQARVESLNEEIGKLCYLPDFTRMLGGLPSDHDAKKVCNKLELRLLAINQLVMQRDMIIDAAKASDYDVDLSDLAVPLNVPDELIVKTVHAPRPTGWSAIKQGFKDILRGWLM